MSSADENRSLEEYSARIDELEGRLAEAEETLRAIHGGEVDALVVAGPTGHQVYTLRGEEHVYRILVESISEGALTLTLDGTIMYANKAVSEMSGIPLEHVIGSRIHDFVCDEHADIISDLVRRASRTNNSGELCLRKSSNGGTMWASASLAPLSIDDELRAISMVMTNLTERKEHEQELSAHQQHLEEQVETRTRELREAYEELQSANDGLTREIDSRKRAEQELAEAKKDAERHAAEIESFFANMTDGAVLHDADGHAILYNAAAREILGADLRRSVRDRVEQYRVCKLDGTPMMPEETGSGRALQGETID
jgi:PAS domain S-box-containing protein